MLKVSNKLFAIVRYALMPLDFVAHEKQLSVAYRASSNWFVLFFACVAHVNLLIVEVGDGICIPDSASPPTSCPLFGLNWESTPGTVQVSGADPLTSRGHGPSDWHISPECVYPTVACQIDFQRTLNFLITHYMIPLSLSR